MMAQFKTVRPLQDFLIDAFGRVAAACGIFMDDTCPDKAIAPILKFIEERNITVASHARTIEDLRTRLRGAETFCAELQHKLRMYDDREKKEQQYYDDRRSVDNFGNPLPYIPYNGLDTYRVPKKKRNWDVLQDKDDICP